MRRQRRLLVTARHQDLTLPPDLSRDRAVGPVRVRRPIYLDLLPPCNEACPAGENIQAWLAKVVEGDDKGAWEILVQDNPMPAVHGRVCYHPCESSCNRGKLESPVSIHAVERYLGDKAIAEGWQIPVPAFKTGKRVLVVGAGPAGLSCAYHLARLGHAVEIREAGPLAGGMMHFGIPAYRLPRNILGAEIARIEAMGVKIVLNHKVEDLAAEKGQGSFDAVFLAIGAGVGKKTEIPAREAGKILDAVSFLKDVELGEAPKLGRKVAIYGGGNTAMDAARVAKRLGVEPLIIYRRDREHMPAHEFEADEAIEEGVKIHWLRTIKSMEAGQIQVEVMKLDEKGKPQPTGEIETLDADDLILALGQDTDTSFLRTVEGIEFQDDGVVVVSPQMMTGHPGIFAGGDMAPSERTVTIAVGHGKKAARNIDGYLHGQALKPLAKKDVAHLEKLRLWFFADAAARIQSQIPVADRMATFGEVMQGLAPDDAQFEARRCFSCGNCFECDGCYGACPEDAIIKLGPGKRYEVDFNLCTGCGTCFDQCPVHAISLVPEPEGVFTK
jgi:formate dehydrogenase beta subunit